MYSHMCQDAAEAEMRAIERITIKEVMGWNWGRWRNTTLFVLSIIFPCFPRKASTLFQWRSSKRISRMDMYVNLGDDEAILWGSEWTLWWWCKWRRRPSKVEKGALLHMHWGRSKPFGRSHIYIAISPELWEPGNPVFGLLLNKESLGHVLARLEQKSRNFPLLHFPPMTDAHIFFLKKFKSILG